MNERIRQLLDECDNHDLARLARLTIYEFQDRNLDTIIDEDLYEYWKESVNNVLGIMLDVSYDQL